jgi:hypothetical protein
VIFPGRELRFGAPVKFVSSSLNHEGVNYPCPIEVAKAERMTDENSWPGLLCFNCSTKALTGFFRVRKPIPESPSTPMNRANILKGSSRSGSAVSISRSVVERYWYTERIMAYPPRLAK